MTTKFGIGIVFRKAQVSAKFNCPTSTSKLFSKHGERRICSSPVIKSQKRGHQTLVELWFTVIHATLDAEVGCPEGSCSFEFCQLHPTTHRIVKWKVALKATFHLTISIRGQRATGKIQRNNYRHGSCGPSLMGKTSSVSLIFTHGYASECQKSLRPIDGERASKDKENIIPPIVSQPSKCLKFMTSREGCLVIHVEYKYLKWSSWDFLSPSVLQKMKKIISVNYMIIMRHSVKNNTSMSLVVSLCSNSNHLISLVPPNGLKF